MTLILTDREQQILHLIGQGFTNKQISRLLSISESTAENHIHHIYTKLRISNRAQAAAQAIQMITAQQDQIMENRGNPS